MIQMYVLQQRRQLTAAARYPSHKMLMNLYLNSRKSKDYLYEQSWSDQATASVAVTCVKVVIPIGSLDSKIGIKWIFTEF